MATIPKFPSVVRIEESAVDDSEFWRDMAAAQRISLFDLPTARKAALDMIYVFAFRQFQGKPDTEQTKTEMRMLRRDLRGQAIMRGFYFLEDHWKYLDKAENDIDRY